MSFTVKEKAINNAFAHLSRNGGQVEYFSEEQVSDATMKKQKKRKYVHTTGERVFAVIKKKETYVLLTSLGVRFESCAPPRPKKKYSNFRFGLLGGSFGARETPKAKGAVLFRWSEFIRVKLSFKLDHLCFLALPGEYNIPHAPAYLSDQQGQLFSLLFELQNFYLCKNWAQDLSEVPPNPINQASAPPIGLPFESMVAQPIPVATVIAPSDVLQTKNEERYEEASQYRDCDAPPKLDTFTRKWKYMHDTKKTPTYMFPPRILSDSYSGQKRLRMRAKNAAKSFNVDTNNERMFAIFDTTFRRSATRGALVTSRGVRFRNNTERENIVFIPFHQFAAMSISQISFLTLNKVKVGTFVFDTNGASRRTVIEFLTNAQKLYGAA